MKHSDYPKTIIATNKKASFLYKLISGYESGISLKGSEVKAIRENKVDIKESYILIRKAEIYIIGMHIGEYSHSGYITHIPLRDRKLLLHRKELIKLKKIVEEKGKTLIPLSLYFNRGKIKIEFALAKGKKLWDKRKSKMDKDIKRQLERNMKQFRK